jgi:hypothetical protein
MRILYIYIFNQKIIRTDANYYKVNISLPINEAESLSLEMCIDINQ